MKKLFKYIVIIGVGYMVYNYVTEPKTPTPTDTVETSELDNVATDDTQQTQLAGSEDLEIAVGENQEVVGGDAVTTVTLGEQSYTVLATNYSYDISEMTVKKGDEVTLTLRSVDGFHDFVIDELSVQSESVATDGETTITFTADTVGEFEYYCSVGSHRERGMVGTLTVTE